MSNVGLRSSTIIWPKTTFGPPSVGYSRASKPFSARMRRTNAAVSGWARLCAEIVGKRTYSLSSSSALPASDSTRPRTSVRAIRAPLAGKTTSDKYHTSRNVLRCGGAPRERNKAAYRCRVAGTDMELQKGVHVIETYATTTLIVDGRLVLIDTSADADAGKILDYLAKIKMKPSDLSTIFITHTHGDHVSGLAALKKNSSAKVATHKIEAEFVSRRKVYDGPPAVHKYSGVPVDVMLEDGQAYDGLRVIFTPGHTRGHISVLDESRALHIAGDAMNNESGLRPMDDRYNVDPKQHRESIKKLAKFHFENAILGHGEPIKGNASAKIADLAKRL